MITEVTDPSKMYDFIMDVTANMVCIFPTSMKKAEYDTDTRQLTVYCVDGSIFRLQMVQIN